MSTLLALATASELPPWADPAMLFSANPGGPDAGKIPSSGYCFTCLPSVPALDCNYSVISEPALVWAGQVPEWLNGTFYKTFSFVNVTDGSKLAQITEGDLQERREITQIKAVFPHSQGGGARGLTMNGCHL